MLYACDSHWWDEHIHQVRETYSGQCVTQSDQAAQQYGLRFIKSRNQPGLSMDPNLIHQGANSGYQAINLAIHFGARCVLLLGYDMGFTDKRHWFGDHPGALNVPSPYQKFIHAFNKMHPEKYGLQIINCSRKTALKCFPQAEIGTAITQLLETTNA